MTEPTEGRVSSPRRYALRLDFAAADDAQAERLAEAWAGTCAAEYGTTYRGLIRLSDGAILADEAGGMSPQLEPWRKQIEWEMRQPPIVPRDQDDDLTPADAGRTPSVEHEPRCPGYDEQGRCHCRVPQLCSCGEWCHYDGWGHVHGNGLGLDEPTAHKSAPASRSSDDD